MTAYVVIICDKTKDLPESVIKAAMAEYAAIAREAPLHGLEILASRTSKLRILEGAGAEVVVVMRFPTMSDALAWHNSDAYQRAIPHRAAVADYRTLLVEGVE